MASGRLFYADPETMQPAEEHIEVKGSFGEAITGRVVYTGGAWVHPSCRNLGLSDLLPRFSKAYAFTRWNPDFLTSLMLERNFQRGLAAKFNYPFADWEAWWGDKKETASRFAVLSIDQTHLIDDLQSGLDRLVAEVDFGAIKRTA